MNMTGRDYIWTHLAHDFPRYWPFVRGIHRSPVNSPHKGQWRGTLMFSVISAWRNGWANNREPDYLRPHHAHYDVIVMLKSIKLYTYICNIYVTIQHSTQSVGNMPPPSPRHLLQHVLQIMPRNPKYDQFQPKGHHNEENPQSTTKMPRNPKFYPFYEVKIASKLEKSTNCNHNLISPESGQDTSACKLSGHFLNEFSRKCLETPNLTRFTKSK